jgi:RimJ/RimL family protein N-acetyltransferase
MMRPKAGQLVLRDDVTIRSLTSEHAEATYQWICDPEIRRNIGLRNEPSLEKTIAWITNAQQDTHTRAFAILLDASHVGNVVLDRFDDFLRMARLSIYIGNPLARGAGVGRTAIHQALSDGFEKASLHKVWLTVHARNVRAIETYSQLGFQLEGILRDEFWLDGKRVAALYMGVLVDDFKNLTVTYDSRAESV